VSTIFACPYQGKTAPEAVREVALALADLGCYEVSLGDTIGVGTPADTRRLLDVVLAALPAERLALHFHDTFGMAAANVMVGLEYGITRFDASAGGLGGCPYAPSASGNLATEDLLYLLHNQGYATGVDLMQVVQAARSLTRVLGHPLPGRVHQAMLGRLESQRC
jgi:hydroxymethylglutaryl-CoA lyase